MEFAVLKLQHNNMITRLVKSAFIRGQSEAVSVVSLKHDSDVVHVRVQIFLVEDGVSQVCDRELPSVTA